MALSTMYKAKPNSPQTTLAQDITADATSMVVADPSVLPTAPNLCTIGDDENAEVVIYTTITGNVVSGLIRGSSGTTASVWTTGTVVARDFTSYDHDTFVDNITALNSDKAPLASPAFTGNPTAPTQTAGNSTTRIATTAFVGTAISPIKGDIGIVEDGDTATHVIGSGQYVIWKGSLYTANTSIAVGGALSSSNLKAVSNGGLNNLNATIFDFKRFITLTSSDDLNNLNAVNTSGVYYLNGIPTNAPAGFGMLLNLRVSSTIVFQFFVGLDSIYYRYYGGNSIVWHNWRQLTGTEVS